MRWSLISVRLIAAITLMGLVTCGALLAALDGFNRMRVGYDEMATRTVPELIAASRISQTAQTIASTAPTLAAVDSQFQSEAVQQRIADQMQLLDRYLTELDQLLVERGGLRELIGRIRENRNALQENLLLLEQTVAERIAIEETLSETYLEARGIHDRLRRLHSALEYSTEETHDTAHEIRRRWYQPIESVLIEVLTVPTLRVDSLVLQSYNNAVNNLANVPATDSFGSGRLSNELIQELNVLKGEATWLIEGERGIFGLVRSHLSLSSRQEGLLNSNKFLANRFVGSVADLILVLRENTLQSSLSFAQAAYSKWLLLIAVMVLSVVAVISLSLYARSRILNRLSELREALIERIAGRKVPIPTKGRDEIGDIGEAAAFFAEAVDEREASLRRAKEEAEDLAMQAEAANRAKSVFLANMSHELRTPLNAIIGFSELINGGHSSQEKSQEYAGDINDSGRHLLELINQLLDYSKIEAGERDLLIRDVDVSTEIESLRKLIHLQLERRFLKLDLTLSDGLRVKADRVAFRQVLLNLLSNACKFAFEGTVITLNVTQKNDMVFLSVKDEGVGIGEEHIERVLQPFQQETDTYIRPSGGTGLGLAIVDNLVRMHGGRVSLESEKGVGTTVTVSFPVAAARRQPVKGTNPAGFAKAAGS